MAKAQRVLSIEIGYSLTQVCEMDYQSKHPKVYGVFSMKTPEGIIDDGYIKMSEQYVQELRSYISANGMTATKVIFAVSSTKIANREATIPMVKENKVRDVIISNVTDFFPVDPNKYQFAHNIMDTVADDAGNKQYRIMVMAAPSDMLEGYYTLAKALSLELASIDYSGNSIFQALRTKLSTGVNLTVKIDERSSLLTVTNNGVITMQRAGIYGANQVIDIMMETDVYGEMLSYDGAIRTLRKNNLVLKAEEEDMVAQKEEEARAATKAHADAMSLATTTGDNSALASATVAAKQAEGSAKMYRLRKDVTYAYQQLISSIVRVIDYYNSKNRDASIDHIVITGIAADFWGFSNLLAAELGRDVEVLKDLAGTSINQGLHLQEVSLGDYITVIGAGLNSIGFMPATATNEVKQVKGTVSPGSMNVLPWVVAGIAVVVGIGLLVAGLVPLTMAKAENQNLLATQSKLEPYREEFKQMELVKSNWQYINAIYAETENPNRELYALFGKMEACMPTETWVTSFTVTNESVTMTVQFDNKRQAAKAIMQLRTIEEFSAVSSTVLKVEENSITKNIETIVAISCVYGINPEISNQDVSAVEDPVADTPTAE